MSLDLLIPFFILIILVIYLIFTRSKFEKEILNSYEHKFEQWKKHNSSNEEKIEHKELVGLVFKTGYKIDIELFEKSVTRQLEKGKFSIKAK